MNTHRTCSCNNAAPHPQPSGSERSLEETATLFKALGSPVRLRLVEQLLTGEKCVCELHAKSGKDLSTISCHLAVLRHSGVLVSEQRGKSIYYRLACPCLAEVLHCLRLSN